MFRISLVLLLSFAASTAVAQTSEASGEVNACTLRGIQLSKNTQITRDNRGNVLFQDIGVKIGNTTYPVANTYGSAIGFCKQFGLDFRTSQGALSIGMYGNVQGPLYRAGVSFSSEGDLQNVHDRVALVESITCFERPK